MDRIEQFILSGGRVGAPSLSVAEKSSGKYLAVNLVPNNGMIEVPDFCLSDLYSLLLDNYTELAYTLYIDDTPRARRLVRGALADFMSSFMQGKIQKVHMASGGSYYGVPGVIFNDQFEILMLMSFSVKYIGHPKSTTVPYMVEAHNCRISPKVFLNQNGIIEKTIIKKVIPYCATHIAESVCDTPYVSDAYVSFNGSTIRVIVEDIDSHFIKQITPPKVSDNIPKMVHDTLMSASQMILK